MANENSIGKALLGLHAQTGLHPGAGTAIGAVDLPVQRERHTQWPTISGSAIKGVLRDVCREHVKGGYEDDAEGMENRRSRRAKADGEHEELVAAFGPPTSRADEHAGAISVTDARLLAFPVRSLKGVFAWVTCPAVLERLGRDAELAGWKTPQVVAIDANQVVVPTECPCIFNENLVVLEEFDFRKSQTASADEIANWIADHVLPSLGADESVAARFRSQLVVLHDDDFTHFVRHATEVTARIALDYETKTVKQGALFYQEFLPAETLLYSVVLANSARAKKKSGPDVLSFVSGVLESTSIVQIGGDETTGKGFCAVRLAQNR